MKNMDVRKRIGRQLADIRRAKGMTQQEVADKAGLLRPHIARIEAGSFSVGIDTLAAIAEALGQQIKIEE
jgi:transcriptional regulator with XRE-family HTH domain